MNLLHRQMTHHPGVDVVVDMAVIHPLAGGLHLDVEDGDGW